MILVVVKEVTTSMLQGTPNLPLNCAKGYPRTKPLSTVFVGGCNKYGEQKTKGVSAKGITVATRTQAQVISPFDGTVIFADKFRGYGNMIIIEHDSGYLSLLSGLGSVDVELGQMLLAGEPVGQMPLSGAAELYIEIRKNNQPINPSAWFKI